MELNFDGTTALLVFLRISGCVLFNPILGRRNIPAVFNIGLCLILTVFIYPLVPRQEIEINSFIVFFVCALKELALGFLIGYIIQMFLAVIVMGGETMDMQIGLSMSKVYDPQSNVSMPLSASLINAMFYLVFFASNAHLTLIKIFTELCVVAPYGDRAISPDIFKNLAGLFSLALVYSIKMSFPVLAAEMISEMAVGLIMRAVPQIDVFVLNIQLKLIIGFVVLLIIAPAMSIFLDRLIAVMFDNISGLFGALA